MHTILSCCFIDTPKTNAGAQVNFMVILEGRFVVLLNSIAIICSSIAYKVVSNNNEGIIYFRIVV